MPSEHDRETAFLRRCIRYDVSTAGRQLDERICQVHRDERCLRRGSWLMTMVAVLASAGLGYGALFLDGFPTRMSVFTSLLVVKIFCAVGIGSLICMVAFTSVGLFYRRELNKRREECRRRVTKLLELHLGETPATRRNGDLQDHGAGMLQSGIAAAPPQALNPQRASPE
jgi:hypothetical protein